MKTLMSERLWPQMQALCNNIGAKRAAVAYVTTDEYVRFGEGDLLVVDASDSSIVAGQTNATVLRQAHERGARLYSYPGLHAKVMVFEETASVGSANISIMSAEQLKEANWISDDPEFTRAANSFIDGLVRDATRIDEDFLARIQALEVCQRGAAQSRGHRSYRRRRPHPVLLYFQEILPGDVRKYLVESADAQTGGGARDLRISPAEMYIQPLRQMFPQQTNIPGVTAGDITWTTASGSDEVTRVELWSPTPARPNELRIGRFYDIGGWDIDENQYSSERAEGHPWFYVLEMGGTGQVAARLLQQQDLELEDPLVADHVEQQIAVSRTDHAARGAVNLTDRSTLP